MDDIFQAARIALDGLSTRQQAITRNVANIDTPGYRAQTVSFEKAVQTALRQDAMIQMKKTNSAHLTPSSELDLGISNKYRPGGSVRADGNNVDLDVELVDMTETVTRYETVSQLVLKRFQLLKEISMQR